MKLKNILIPVVAILLLVGIVFTGGQVGVLFASIDWGNFSDHFTQGDKTVTLTVETTEGGTVSKTEDAYKKGSMVSVTATPNEGYIFAGWYSVDDIYLTTAKTYSFEIKKDTVLKAKFAEKPEDMDGKYINYETLRNCSTDFAFTIVCDREDAEAYLLENLKIVDAELVGTEWEEQARASFTVERVEDTNEYRIVPVEGERYEEGATYTATLPEVETEEEPPEATFVESDNTSNTLNFTIGQEETKVIEYNEDIVYLVESEDPTKDQVLEVVDDGLAEGDEGDVEDYVILPERFGITEKTIICVFGGVMVDGLPELGPEAFFGKVQSIEELANGTFRVVYGLPDMAEIFDKLDIYMDGETDLEGEGVEITDQTVEEIRFMLLSNESFQNYVASAYQVALDGVAGTDYEVELLSKQNFVDMLDIKIVPRISGDTAEIDINISVNIPIKNKSNNQVLHLSLKMNMHKSIQVSRHANVKLRTWWFIPVGISSYDFNAGITDREELSLGVAIAYDTGSDGFHNLDKNFAEERFMAEFSKIINGNKPIFQTIKDTFDESGYAAESDLRIVLFKMTFNAGIVSFNFDVNLFLRFDIGATAHFSSSAYNKMIVGIRSSQNGAQNYKIVENQSKTSDWILAGKIDIRTGVRLEAYIGLVGLSKYVRAGIGFEVGEYVTAAGCISLGTQHLAGFVEKGAYWQADIFYRVFSISGEWELAKQQYPLFCYGYEESLLSYANQNDLKKGATIGIVDKEVALFHLDKLAVKLLDAENSTLKVTYLDPQSSQYTITVTFKDGSHMSYKNGKLVVDANAPLYFEDEITITVKSNHATWTWFEDGKCSSYLPTVTLKIEYGDEDRYYDSIDGPMKKEFRRLYRSYQADNAKFLRDNFQNMISSGIDIPEKFMAIFDHFVMEYLDQLFDTIHAYKAQENGEKNRKMENQFVNSEAEAFEEVFTFMKNLIEKEELGKLQTDKILRLVVDSNALYNTFIVVAESEEVALLAEQFVYTDEETKAAVREALDDYAKGANDKELALVEALREILGFTEVPVHVGK